jgi:NAD(P)-dependent dehydrogenase (short-subunit alcohol dehydrogenase family)
MHGRMAPERRRQGEGKVPDYFDMTGKVVLVTGGSRGLGHEMVKAFAACGADIVVSSRKADACERVAEEVRAMGRRAAACPAHVGRWADVDALAAQALAAFGRIDVLVNNAGIAPVAPSSAEISEDLFDKTVAVNFKGPFRLSALIAPTMAAAGGGAIINISSMAAVKPSPEYPIYAGAKAALNALTRAHAHEYGPKVRVNGIMCGPFRTDIAASWADELDRTIQSAARRIGRPEEIATAALYFASDRSGYTTGTIIEVDGGLP